MFHHFLSRATAEQKFCPAPGVPVGRKLMRVLIMQEFSLQDSLKTPLSKVQFVRNFPTPIIEETVAIVLVELDASPAPAFPVFLRVPIFRPPGDSG